jgi:hypothetical protein
VLKFVGVVVDVVGKGGEKCKLACVWKSRRWCELINAAPQFDKQSTIHQKWLSSQHQIDKAQSLYLEHIS